MTGLRQVLRSSASTMLVAALCVLLMPGVAQAVPPANDAFADAIDVTEPLPFTDTQDTTEATVEAGEPDLGDVNCGADVTHTVWYAYVPTVDTVVSANTFGSDFDTVLGVWEGTDLATLELVGCRDDSRELDSSVVFLAEAGVEYRIQIGGFAGSTGMLEFKVRETAAGFIEGTVTDETTGDPIEDACAFVADEAFGDQNGGFALTREDGTYRAAVRPGEYKVFFADCIGGDYIPEWWDDVAEDIDATEIVVGTGTTTSGIDAALAPSCPGWGFSSRNQVIGTAGPDDLVGTAGRDVLCGLGDDDTLRGGDGGDIILGGGGNDVARGGVGNDELVGGPGDDLLNGGPGRDFMNGGSGHDVCRGGEGRDFLRRSCEVAID